ncbi:glycosyltransferase involved in cell wall biosynthesis [Neobacillus niacini]|uniref:glycosyltransferase n=1 Tax=Neobacillus niacini TaxID=86668 RepID=UPI00278A8FF7|nr:glycosyltransferase [Neobacillus niacini]MDQ1000338.1 glycosyltransferase involved in cell wall biosynthesis [Neobacillus niacini]
MVNQKISVIVPIYNVEKYLPQCIESIINQTYKNLEVILVNDGSPDNSGEVCNFYRSKDNRIKVIHKDNGGLSEARNIGLDNASGDYVSFIDSDDYIHERFYEILFNMIISTNAEIAQCGFTKVYEEKNIKGNIKNQVIVPTSNKNILNKIESLTSLFNQDYVVSVVVWNKLYRKELFDNIRFPVGKIHEDEFTTYQLLYKSKKLALTKIPLYYYLQRTNSIMGEKFNSKRLDVLEAYSNQISFYTQENLFDLKKLALNRLESLIREYMILVLNSDLANKEQIFNFLVNYYRNNFHFFYHQLDQVGNRKLISYLLKYCPIGIVKILNRIIVLRMNITRVLNQRKG